MPFEMKKTFSLALSVLICGCAQPSFSTEFTVYSNDVVDMVVLESKSQMSLAALGGSIRHDAGAAADCFVMSDLTLTEEGPQDPIGKTLIGELRPVHTDLVSYDQADITSAEVRLSMRDASITVHEMDVFDLCGMGTDFSGNYEQMDKSHPGYQKAVVKLLLLIHENALHMHREGRTSASISDLRPFFAPIDDGLIEASKQWPAVTVAHNDFAYFLQQEGLHEEAISHLRRIVTYAPDRTVAWLNLADSLWDTGSHEAAGQAYRQYILLMEKSEATGRVPRRAAERSGAAEDQPLR